MVGLRFSLVLDLGVGTAATGKPCARHGYRVRRVEEGRRAVVLSPIPPRPEDLGWGPLEPEIGGCGVGEPQRSHGARQ